MKMKSSRWLNINLPVSLEELGDRMLENQYLEGKETGFIINKRNKYVIIGKHVQEKSFRKDVEDPFGNKKTYDRVEYYVTNFNFTGVEGVELQIDSPPKSLKPFITSVANLVGLGFSASNIKIDPLRWLGLIEEKLDKTKVVSIECSKVNVANKGLANINFTGVVDIRSAVDSFLNDQYRYLDKVVCAIEIDGIEGRLELRSTGMACFKNIPSSKLIPMLKETICLAV